MLCGVVLQIGLVSTYQSLENGGNIAITICSVDLLLIGITMVRLNQVTVRLRLN